MTRRVALALLVLAIGSALYNVGYFVWDSAASMIVGLVLIVAAMFLPVVRS